MGSNTHRGITFVGLGPGDPDRLTRQAWNWLEGAAQIAVHPCLAEAILNGQEAKLVRLGGTDASVEGMVAQLVELAQQPGGITYAAPGAPFEGDCVAQQACQQALAEGLPVVEIAGVSLFEAARAAIGELDGGAFIRMEAGQLAGRHVPPFPPSLPALLAGIDSQETAEMVHAVLSQVYPADFTLQKIEPGQAQAESLALGLIAQQEEYSPFDVFYLPASGPGTSLEDFQEVIAHLRAPNGCPWDREQTHMTLRKHLLEETYETLEALDADDIPGMVEEFGDLLFQVVIHAQIANEMGEFRMADVVQGIYDKIIRRHPHVFGDVQVDGVKDILQNWERLKAVEREGSLRKKKKESFLDGVPAVFPSLAQAQEIQDRAARVNFDWKEIDGVVDKVDEELAEVKNAPDLASKTAEIGDLLFAVVNLARWEKVDAESALRETNARFRRRFAFIEAAAKAQEVALDELGFEEMNRLWDEAKKNDL